MATVGGGKLSATGPLGARPTLQDCLASASTTVHHWPVPYAHHPPRAPRLYRAPAANSQDRFHSDCNEAMLAIQKLAQMFPQATTSAHGCGLVAPDAYQHSAAVLPLAPAAPKDVPTLKQRRKVVLEEALDDLAIR